MGKTLEVVQDPKGGIQGISLWEISVCVSIDFTMGEALEVVQDPKGGIQGISLWEISGIR